jgi:glycosyltransferase involved in cell wall biosynthesis
MNVVYLSNSTIPSRTANSLHVMKMCQALAQAGHQVRLVGTSTGRSSTEAEASPFAHYGVEECFDLTLLPRPSMPGGHYLFALGAALDAWVHGADLVYGRDIFSCFFASLLGLPVVLELHAPPQELGERNRQMFAFMVRHALLRRVVVISEALRETMRERYGLSPSCVRVAHDAADADAVAGQASLTEIDRLQVGYVGHLYPGKGMEVIAALAPACPWADFHVVGGTEADLARWRGELAEAENVTFHGYVPNGRTPAYRRAFDVCLAPYQRSVSISSGSLDVSRWMSPLKIFEYMSAGKAILCSNLLVLREVLTHDHNAWLCSPDRPGDWVEALEHLRDEPETRRRLGKQARQDFEAKHTWEARAKNVLALA